MIGNGHEIKTSPKFWRPYLDAGSLPFIMKSLESWTTRVWWNSPWQEEYLFAITTYPLFGEEGGGQI